MLINNETVGISAEVAIAREFGVNIDPYYESRADEDCVNTIIPCVRKAFTDANIPTPVRHVAEGQNPVDFILKGEKTLSVKTNQEKFGKVAPQQLGQPTSRTYFTIMSSELGEDLSVYVKLDNYPSKARAFKEISMTRTVEVLNVYWRHMFECDYLIHFYNILYNCPKYVVLGKLATPKWDPSQFSFTQTLDSWNESCTIKHKGRAIGEFQVHNNRDCFKFRFNMDGMVGLLNDGML